MKPRVLMIAFACNPSGGGEHWLGWGWAEQAAKSYDVTLVAWDRFEKEIKLHAPAAGINPICIGVPNIVNKIGDKSGLGRWLRQIVWHRRAAAMAARLHTENPFALVHQTTFHTFRIPLSVSNLGIPAVWGPIAGGESTPPGFGAWLGRLKYAEAMRRIMNSLMLARPAVQKSLRAARVIFVSNQTTLNFLPVWCRERCTIVPPNAVRGVLLPPPARPMDSESPLNLLFVGNCVATRSIPLVLQALCRLPDLPWRLTVVGGGSSLSEWKDLARSMAIENRVGFTGAIPRSDVEKHYPRADVFVFPALRDSGGSGLLEAMSFGLPVICCDWGGPAEMVDEGSGIKVSVENPEATIDGFAAAIEKLYHNPELRQTMGSNAFTRAQKNFSWAWKRKLLDETYQRCLGARR
jgi:glycosyltransferase involved in cell wall biosynthesis